MSENSLTKLREAINRRLRVRTGLTTAVEFDEASLGLQAALAAVEQEMAALEAERDELRKDKERLDWLDMNCVTHLPEQRGAPATDSWCFMSRPAPLREAIDIALYAEKAAP